MSSKSGRQEEGKSDQPKPNEEQKEVADPGQPPKDQKKEGGDE
jgi:hypothetical protein